jgi:hypothetical protein
VIHPMHPTRHDWHWDCLLCHEMVCPDCGHLRDDHSNQGQCLPGARLKRRVDCPCRNRKGLALFLDTRMPGR